MERHASPRSVGPALATRPDLSPLGGEVQGEIDEDGK